MLNLTMRPVHRRSKREVYTPLGFATFLGGSTDLDAAFQKGKYGCTLISTTRGKFQLYAVAKALYLEVTFSAFSQVVPHLVYSNW